MRIIVTDHAVKQAADRLGWNYTKLEAVAKRAWQRGTRREAAEAVRVTFGHNVFVFAPRLTGMALATVWAPKPKAKWWRGQRSKFPD